MRSYAEFRKTLDSVFKRDDVRGIWGEELTAELAFQLGRAFAESCGAHESESESKPKIILGRDMRIGSPEFALNLKRGMKAAGAVVEELGMCGSELIYYLTGANPHAYAGGAMVTASHNPPEYAGVKFVKSGAEPLSSDELTALKMRTAELYGLELQCALEGPRLEDRAQKFAEKLCAVAGLEEPAESTELKVVVEAGNGMGGTMAAPVLEVVAQRLPGCTFIYADDVPDGRFPLCTPNPLFEEYRELLAARVKKEGADLGICFDGDADRAGFADNEGKVIDASVVSIILFDRLKDLHPNRKTVMGNLNTSLRLTDYVKAHESAGYRFVTTPVGHAKIKQLMRSKPFLGDADTQVLFASEHSGHYFYPDFFYADSGMTTALLLIAKAHALRREGKKLSDFTAPYHNDFFASGELNEGLESDAQAVAKIKEVSTHELCKGGRFRCVVEDDKLHKVATQDSYDPEHLAALDLRVDCPEGEKLRWWFSLRKSGNEPALRLNVEARTEEKMCELRDQLLSLLRS